MRAAASFLVSFVSDSRIRGLRALTADPEPESISHLESFVEQVSITSCLDSNEANVRRIVCHGLKTRSRERRWNVGARNHRPRRYALDAGKLHHPPRGLSFI